MLEYQASGNTGTDLEDTDIFQFQCKRYANYCPIGKIHEVRLTDANNIPVLVTQGNRMECMAVLPFSKLVTLIEIAYGLAPRLIHPGIKKPKGLTPPAILEYREGKDTGMTFHGQKIYEIPEGTIPLDLSSII
jgi:hypothetical protein